MRRLFTAAFASMLVGVASGLFYREFTKINGFPEGAPTQLGLVHTHLLVLGFVVFLVVMLLEKAFALSESRLFGWFFWTYTAGLVLTSAMLVWHGCLTVLGQESTKMIAGIAGVGHMLLAAGMVLLFLALRPRVFAPKVAAARPATLESVA
ncbi:DUF2871 domain-containing protein [Microbacterium sp. HSID17254]|uniref:DUF2871 domain-containing protein n=1 Tax=Microbacterium TaxID=33882 RepID=UPI0004681D77|nr:MULTISPECIES: DUF2871 domain-containing protein [Microbacterium]AMG82980.1 hypothetical protein AXH82_06020 [Microbacterium sp. PAMC 28756]MPT13570.1 DUF2871 domain-containing protein [Microbacterium sp.]OIJ32504.1 hypothetical protein BK819_12225 [Microbacterium sp. LCT-H2]QXE29865.1 DUF2871 domain-containing protein [Microbacterium paraoxydans]RUQ03040.1 DUF2871 domain-containing protein [Microbacterium sp. HSID17254]